MNDDLQLFEKMKLADLKNECRRLNLSTTGTKTKLIEKLRNAKVKMSGKETILHLLFNNLNSFHLDTTIIPSNPELSSPQSTPSVRLLSKQISSFSFHSFEYSVSLVSTSSLTDQELYHQRQQKIVELENQLQKLKQLDSYPLQSAHLLQHIDHNTSMVKNSLRLSRSNNLSFFSDPTEM